MIDYIVASDADIVCLQESNLEDDNKFGKLKKKFGVYPYQTEMLVGDTIHIKNGLACFSRYPIVYINKVLQKRVLAQYLLKSEANKLTVDNLIHPVIARDFLQSGYSWLESAILFDSGFYKRIDFDFIVCVSAPLETRVQRVMKRDGITEEKALEWIHKQWPQEKVEQHSDYVIVNDGIRDLEDQIKELLNTKIIL